MHCIYGKLVPNVFYRLLHLLPKNKITVLLTSHYLYNLIILTIFIFLTINNEI
jgi:hypothetical protein